MFENLHVSLGPLHQHLTAQTPHELKISDAQCHIVLARFVQAAYYPWSSVFIAQAKHLGGRAHAAGMQDNPAAASHEYPYQSLLQHALLLPSAGST